MRDLIEQWLWMQAMNTACERIYHKARRCVEFKPGTDYPDYLRDVYEFAHKNFSKMKSEVPTGGGCGDHNGFSIGYDFHTTSKGVTTQYKNREVFVAWTEVKDFIEDMITEEKQITMFELLLEGAQQ